MPALLTSDESPTADNDINVLTNINDIRESLRLLDQEETDIDTSLDQLLSQQDNLQAILSSLHILRPQLDELQQDSTLMMETIQNTARLAINISDKVRQLDKEQSRTRQAISYVDDVQELKRCIAGIQQAMAHKEYDEAAAYLQKTSQIDRSILNGSLAEFTVVRSPSKMRGRGSRACCTLDLSPIHADLWLSN
ncbi:hypothetical protein DM01DRAFT_1290514 [Hesseltinella vesiculosa]|uniref:Conserved oligomeric Golgi complex subunit 4 N-terminal domain-containing protein n=1 Tax=Hesseltinella vesiculosa TaxID=101127 RepID=A0A1X2GC52_9FUNG|nr:hypothetical protein DM01DRAFT_1290514 [Hesseltinella vesiculosa]